MGLKTRILSNFGMRDGSDKNYYGGTNTEVIVMEKYSDVARMREIASDLGVSYYAIAAILTNKSLKTLTEGEIKDLLDADIEKRHPMETYPETLQAIDELKRAAAAGEHIGVYGDYDGDGVTSALIISEALADLTDRDKIHQQFARVGEDGFGFGVYGLEELAAQGCKTIMVVDTGSNSEETLARAAELGIKCIVMDHHEFNEDTKKLKDVIYINPHLYPKLSNENELKNAGMSWYFSRKLYEETLETIPEKLHRELLVYAALGTVADAGNQLEGEYDRALLHYGLQPEILSSVKALPELMGGASSLDNTSDRAVITGIQTLSLGKRITTVKPYDVFRILSNQTPDEQRSRLTQELIKRTADFNATSAQASEEIAASYRANPGSVVVEVANADTVPPEFVGTSGSIAGRVTRQLDKPAFIFVKNSDGTYKGSYRTGKSKMDGLEVLTRLNNKYPEVMTVFGGHGAAGGVTIENDEKLAQFKDLMTKFVDYQIKNEPSYVPASIKVKENSWDSDGRSKFFVTAKVADTDLKEDNFSDIFRLTPFSGFGIKHPSYYSKGIVYKGRKKDVESFSTSDGRTVEFKNSAPDQFGKLTVGAICDVVFEVFRAKGKTGFVLKDLQLPDTL